MNKIKRETLIRIARQDRMIHAQWARYLKSNPDFDSHLVGSIAWHHQWARYYAELENRLR